MERWRIALVQHPMILSVHEDRGEPVIIERVPSWGGAADMIEYSERVRRNLDALRKHPDLKLNYEFSGVELQILIDCAPDVQPVMREMVERGQLGFVGGDYSQPHGQLFGGELNLRQLEQGLRAFKELAGYRVRTYFHQETCLHDQLPQLLKAFGFETAVPPMMAHAMTIIGSSRHPHLVANDYSSRLTPAGTDSVASWQGLDGTEIPLVVVGITDAHLNIARVRTESHAGLYRCSGLAIFAPDMQEISQEHYDQIRLYGKSVLLDEALLEEVSTHRATWKVRLYSYWSYSEGEWAEAVVRQIRKAEALLFAEESLTAVCGMEGRQGFETDLRTVLAAMHHDVNWIGITDLKKTYLARLEQVMNRSRVRIAELHGGSGTREATGKRIQIVNPLPYDRNEVVRISLEGTHRVEIRSDEGVSVPAQCVPAWNQPGWTDVFFLAHVEPLGSSGYRVILTGEDLPAPDSRGPWADVRAGAASFRVAENGTVLEATIHGHPILKGPGNDLRYPSEDGTIVGGAGRPGTMRCFSGEIGHILRVDAPIGDIPVEIEFIASPFNPCLEFSTRFHFSGNAIGVMWEDWTKLNSYWSIDGDRIRHDIPFGAIDGDDTLPLYAPGWVSVRSDTAGLSVLNTGTPKHFVQDGVLGCVLAWGGQEYSNRQGQAADEYIQKICHDERYQYDLKLHGEQTIRSGAMALAGDTTETDLARAAQCLNSPLLVLDAGESLPAEHQHVALDMGKSDLIVTAVFLQEGRLCHRFFEGAGKSHSIESLSAAAGCGLRVTDLKGQPLDQVQPYQIGCIYRKG
jgi:hypothetical protein